MPDTLPTLEEIRVATLIKLYTTRDLLLTRIQEEIINGGPDYDLDGQEFKSGEYLDHLKDLLGETNKNIDRLMGPQIKWVGVPRVTNPLPEDGP